MTIWTVYAIYYSTLKDISYELLQAAFDSYPSCIGICDLDGKVLLVSKQCASIFNTAAENLPGKTVYEIHSDLDLKPLFNRVLEQGYLTVQQEYTGEHGQTSSSRIVGFLLKNSTGVPLSVIMVFVRIGEDLIYDMFNKTLKVTEIAEDMRVSRQTVHTWIDEGILPAIQVGKTFRIMLKDYEDFKTKHQQP